MIHKILTVAGIAALTLVGCQASDPVAREQALTAEGWERLDQAGMMAVTIDMTHAGSLQGGGEWVAYYAPDGSVRGLAGDSTDSDTYTISSDGVYCRQWTTFAKGQEGCAHFYKRGNELKSVKVSGTYNPGGAWTFEPGNTRNL